MYRQIKYPLILFLLLIFLSAKSQYYILGQDPASVQWKQLKTPSATFIFPKEATSMAQRYANLLQISHQAVATPYLKSMRPIKIVLHNRSTLSNAMVSPTPMHADIFLTPDQVTYAQTWAKQLTLHEYRHAVQMQKLRQGLSGGLYYAFGDQAIGAIMGLFMPFWFIEGDAVLSETIHSKSGRGRTPSFMMDLKAQVIEKGVYPYDKAQYGSYRNYVPDHYTLGYQLVLYGLLNYDSQIWDYTLNKVARRPYSLMPFSNGIRKFAGTGKADYYRKTIHQLGEDWKTELPQATNKHFIPQPVSSDFTNYRFVLPLQDGSVVAQKLSMDDVNQFVRIDPSGREHKVFTPGYDFAQSLSGNDSLLVWNEKSFDPRWSNQDYSVIKVHHLHTGKTQTLTKKTKLFAPALSNNGQMIAAIRVDESNQYSLQWMDSNDGKVMGTFQTPDNWFLMFPSWADDDQSLVMVALGDEGKAIIRYHLKNNQMEILVPFGLADISQPILNSDLMVFKAAYNGTDNLYGKHLDTGNLEMLTQSRFGASDPAFSPSGESLYYVDYTSNGYRMAKLDLKNRSFKMVGFSAQEVDWPVDALVTADEFVLDNVTVSDTNYQIENYSRWRHLFNFHSWGLTAVDLENYSYSPGLNVLSQNVLSTSVAYGGYYYDPNEQNGKWKVGFDYMGWYPVIKLSAETGRRKQYYTDNAGDIQQARWRETDVSAGISVPLNFTSSRWIKGVEPYLGASTKFLNMDNDVAVSFREDQVISVSSSLFGYVQHKRSLRDLYPKWGQSLQLNYRQTPFSDSVSQQFALMSTTYLPGIIRHHGIRLYAAYQWLDNGNYSYSNLVSMPRGYSNISMSDMVLLKADYALPIAYPDWDIPSVLFLKRISAHLFYDVASGKDYHLGEQTFASAGAELYTDWHFLGLLPEIRLGVRESYRFLDEQVEFEFLFGFSF